MYFFLPLLSRPGWVGLGWVKKIAIAIVINHEPDARTAVLPCLVLSSQREEEELVSLSFPFLFFSCGMGGWAGG